MVSASDFEWPRAFSKGKSPAPPYQFEDGEIRQVGTGIQGYRPLATKGLYLEFARLDSSPESCIAFASRFGLLTQPANLRVPGSEPHALWKREIARMRELVNRLPRMIRDHNTPDVYANVGTLDVLLVPGASGAGLPELVIEPKTLLQAMNLQFALWLAGGGELHVCEQCGRPFQAGLGGTRRSIAKFCSVECKNRNHYERRTRK